MSGNSSKIIAFNYFGGKFTYLDDLYQHFPVDFVHLVDLFAGSFSVSLNYKGNVIKTANEINQEVTNFFTVLRDQPEELLHRLHLTPVSNAEYNACWDITGDPIERARRFYVRCRQSFYGLGSQRKNKGWHMAKSQLNSKGGEAVSKWRNALIKLYEVAEIIRDTFQILNLDYKAAIDKVDAKGVFIYADPPYPLSCRKSQKDYRFEFSDDNHVELINKLNTVKSRAMISSYENDLYNDLLTPATGWTKVRLTPKENNIRTGKVQECIWFNYPIEETRAGQASLFDVKQQP